MPGPEIQANAVSTALRGFPLKSVPSWVNVLADPGARAARTARSACGSTCSGRWWLAISAAVVYVVATQLAFQLGWVLSFVYPFGALVLSSVGSLAAHYLLAAFERERVRDVFSRFVPESVVEQVLARTDDDLRLGGVSLVGTIMFTDLRGFTTFSESLPGRPGDPGGELLPERDDRGDPRARRHARLVRGRRHHGGLRRADRAAGSRRPRSLDRARDARGAAPPLQRLAA